MDDLLRLYKTGCFIYTKYHFLSYCSAINVSDNFGQWRTCWQPRTFTCQCLPTFTARENDQTFWLSKLNSAVGTKVVYRFLKNPLNIYSVQSFTLCSLQHFLFRNFQGTNVKFSKMIVLFHLWDIPNVGPCSITYFVLFMRRSVLFCLPWVIPNLLK